MTVHMNRKVIITLLALLLLSTIQADAYEARKIINSELVESQYTFFGKPLPFGDRLYLVTSAPLPTPAPTPPPTPLPTPTPTLAPTPAQTYAVVATPIPPAPVETTSTPTPSYTPVPTSAIILETPPPKTSDSEYIECPKGTELNFEGTNCIRLQEAPGFEAAFAIAGLIAVAYFVIGRRDS